MKHLRASDHKRMPWKNGGGETVEIAVSPEGTGLADFDWRVSMATVTTDGPFSVFQEIDRTLSILDGKGMTLFIEGRKPERLTQASAPFSFPADAPTSATLIGGTITDLNVMTRRGRFTHSVQRLSIDGTVALPTRGGQTLVLCHRGQAKAAGLSLSESDCLLLEAGDQDITMSGTAELFQIDILSARQA